MPKIKNLTVYDRIYRHLFDDKEKTKLSENDYKVKQRVQAAFTKKLDHPTITDKSLVKFICETFDVSFVTAYSDLNGIEMMFGDIRKANKEYIRMVVTETQKDVINMEKSRLVKNLEAVRKWEDHERNEKGELPPRPDYYSTKDLTNAVAVLARANNLDKEDPNMPNWEDVQPPIIEPTDDVTIMDLDAVPERSIQLLKEKYLGKISEIQEASDL